MKKPKKKDEVDNDAVFRVFFFFCFLWPSRHSDCGFGIYADGSFARNISHGGGNMTLCQAVGCDQPNNISRESECECECVCVCVCVCVT